MLLELQGQGCHNINFVTPTHEVSQILEALPRGIEGGLKVPLVYNSGGYDSLETLDFWTGSSTSTCRISSSGTPLGGELCKRLITARWPGSP